MLVLSAVVLLGTYTFLPSLLEGFVARDLQAGLAQRPEVDLASDPPPSMLLGKFEEGRVTLTDPAPVGDVRLEEVTVDLEPFDLDVLESLRRGRVESEEPLSGRLRAELSEEEVARIAASSGVVAPVRSVRLEEGYLVIDSEVEVSGVRIPVGVEGDLGLRDGELRFEPRRLEVFGESVPNSLAQGLLRGTTFAYPIGELPFGAEISGVEVREGRLVLAGEVESLPTG